MPDQTPRVITLEGLADGAASELFHAAVARVLENIADPNTDHKAKRSIGLLFEFHTDENRAVGRVQIRCTTKLASGRGTETVVFYGTHEGERVAVEQPRQQDLFPKPAGQPRPVAMGEKE